MPTPLAIRFARSIARFSFEGWTATESSDAAARVATCLFDLAGCALEARDLPWSLQARKLAQSEPGAAHVLGTRTLATAQQAAFANAVMAHGLVREDMHTGSVSHLGVVVLPTLLALAETGHFTGQQFIAAAICGYEAGAALGRALMDQRTVLIHRPTGITGPIAAAAAGAKLLSLDIDSTASALSLAANTASGFNEWPRAGGDEMFFHAGFAARNALTCIELARLGAAPSLTSFDGPAGLFAALGHDARSAATVEMFQRDRLEIFEVFHKPAPACNYAQTATQAAVALSREVETDRISSIEVRVTEAALNYPGCNQSGPFSKALQAKMSIQFCVAAALARGEIAERNYRGLADPEINRLSHLIQLEDDSALTSAYPRRQGAEVIITTFDGRTFRHRLDDLVPSTAADVRCRFLEAASSALSPEAAERALKSIESLETLDCVNLAPLLSL